MQDLHFIIPLLLVAQYLRNRISRWLLSEQNLRNKHVLFYRIFDRIKERGAKIQYLKGWIDLPHFHYLEYALRLKDLTLSMDPFEDDLGRDEEFRRHLEAFPKLKLKELSLRSDQITLIAVFSEGYGPESLKAEFPEELKDWLLRTAEFIEKAPGNRKTSWLIKLDRYTDYLIQQPFLFIAVCFMSFIPASFLPLTSDTSTDPKIIPLLYLVGMGIIFLCFFLSKKSLLLRSVSKLLIILLAVTAVQLLAVVHKS